MGIIMSEVTIETEKFGTYEGKQVDKITLKNESIEVSVLSFGCMIQALKCKDRDGFVDDIVTGWDTFDNCVKNIRFTGRIIGRYANRIKDGKFSIDGNEYQLEKNNGENALHGGLVGFDRKVYDYQLLQDGVKLTYFSEDLEEGYPGNLELQCIYKLDGNSFEIDYIAKTDKPTIINITNHSYFNLDGNQQWRTMDLHTIKVNASEIVPVDDTGIPTGGTKSVDGTVFDLREEKFLTKENLDAVPGKNGYDHNYCCKLKNSKDVILMASLKSHRTGRKMDLYGSQPGLQVYTGNFVNATGGKNGNTYRPQSCICLEPQHFPDSPNNPDFPTTILRESEEYHQKVKIELSTF